MLGRERLALVTTAAFLAVACALLVLAKPAEGMAGDVVGQAHHETLASDPQAEPEVWCVAPSADGCNDALCELSGTCFSSIQDALGAGPASDVEIRVARGHYTDMNDHGGGCQAVYIDRTITIRGGYAPDDFQTFDPVANPTTLDARGIGRVMVIRGNISPTVEGLRMTGGNATGMGGLPTWDVGGGVYVDGATATISNCVVYSNTASTATFGSGGGLYLGESAATLIGNEITGNMACSATAKSGTGGGLSLRGSPAVLESNTIAGNVASTEYGGYGGGVCLIESPAKLTSNTVTGNVASTAHTGYGGGLYLSQSEAELRWNSVEGNRASTAYSGEGGGLYLEDSPATLASCTVEGNTASTVGTGYGGGLYLESSHAQLNYSKVLSNTASMASPGSGGGLYVHWSSVNLRGNKIVGNTASSVDEGRGGGLYVLSSGSLTMTNNVVAANHASKEGGGLWLDSIVCEPITAGRLRHNTIADNTGGGLSAGGSTQLTASTGQGIYAQGYTTLAFTNTIIAGHAGTGITLTADSKATLEATLWYGNGSDTGGEGTIQTGTVNFHGSPAFVSPAAWDYHLTGISAAIDRGVYARVGVDMDGDSRPAGNGYDIGADEFVCRAVTSVTISGPTEGVVGTTYTFTATAQPAEASPLITFTWSPTPDNGQGTANASYVWTTDGAKSIQVTASNCGGPTPASVAHTITIVTANRVFLPVVLRGHP